mmetsp:Transcript_54966/g.110422  ORF Transcript_54966/g.110422 Transcript_54966/m.110422 type:complete len:295 (+) Transcript_54966:85-969(+)
MERTPSAGFRPAKIQNKSQYYKSTEERSTGRSAVPWFYGRKMLGKNDDFGSPSTAASPLLPTQGKVSCWRTSAIAAAEVASAVASRRLPLPLSALPPLCTHTPPRRRRGGGGGGGRAGEGEEVVAGAGLFGDLLVPHHRQRTCEDASKDDDEGSRAKPAARCEPPTTNTTKERGGAAPLHVAACCFRFGPHRRFTPAGDLGETGTALRRPSTPTRRSQVATSSPSSLASPPPVAAAASFFLSAAFLGFPPHPLSIISLRVCCSWRWLTSPFADIMAVVTGYCRAFKRFLATVIF